MPLVAKLFSGVQPVVVGILAWATWSIGRANIRNWQAAVIGVLAAVALFFKVDVLLVVLGCGVLGIVLRTKGSRDKGTKGSGETKSDARSQIAEAGSEEGEQTKAEGGSQRPKAKSQNGGRRKANGERLMAFAPPLLMVLFAAAAAGPSAWQKAGELALVFLKVGAATFGGGFASIPFLQHEVVDVRHWLTMREFIDGVALGQVTPGPVAITGAFVGYRVLGFWGAVIAYLGTFLPSFLMLLGLIHVYRRVQYNRVVQGFLSGVMPAVTGMLLSATVFVGRSAIAGPVQAVLAPLTLCLLLRFKVEPVWLILGGALVGLVMV
jgi:chromate transporter